MLATEVTESRQALPAAGRGVHEERLDDVVQRRSSGAFDVRHAIPGADARLPAECFALRLMPARDGWLLSYDFTLGRNRFPLREFVLEAHCERGGRD